MVQVPFSLTGTARRVLGIEVLPKAIAFFLIAFRNMY